MVRGVNKGHNDFEMHFQKINCLITITRRLHWNVDEVRL